MGRAKKSAYGCGVIYARFSSHSQREVSIEQQIKAAQEYAVRNGIKVIGVYQDKAISGRTDSRPEFQRMMRDAEKGKFQVVIAWKSNRMGRNMLKAMINEATLSDYGVRCLYVEEDFEDTAAGRFALRNMMNVNEFYSEAMAEDIRRGLHDNAEKCMVNGSVPYGYMRGPDGKYAIHQDRAEVIREIFTKYLDGSTFADIVRDLNARGIRTGRGQEWNKSSLPRILSNETYIGVYSYAGHRTEGGVPAIISREVFAAVKQKLKDKPNASGRHRERSDYLLTGKLYCGHCGSPMIGYSGTSRTGDKHHYYICQKKRIDKSCGKKNVRRDLIERRVVEVIRESLMDDSVLDLIVAGYDKFLAKAREESLLATYETELAEVKQSLENIMSAIEKGIINDMTKQRMDELLAQQKDLELSIAAEKAVQNAVPKEALQYWLESWRDKKEQDPKVDAQMISAFVKAVYLFDTDKDNLKIVCRYKKDNDNTITATLGEIDSLGVNGSYTDPSSPPRKSTTHRVVLFLGIVWRFEQSNATAQWAVARPRLDGGDTIVYRFPSALSNMLIRTRRKRYCDG